MLRDYVVHRILYFFCQSSKKHLENAVRCGGLACTRIIDIQNLQRERSWYRAISAASSCALYLDYYVLFCVQWLRNYGRWNVCVNCTAIFDLNSMDTGFEVVASFSN